MYVESTLHLCGEAYLIIGVGSLSVYVLLLFVTKEVTAQADENMKEGEHLFISGGSSSLYNHCG